MDIKVDLHCHTLASTHAYSTVKELAEEAHRKGMEAIAITDHAPALPDAPHIWHFENLHAIPPVIDGIKILYGTEANILDLQGNIDMPEHILKRMDIVVASIHYPAYKDAKADTDDHTSAYLGALDNPYVNIIGHSGSEHFPYRHDDVLLKAKSLGKLIEINNHSFIVRHGSIPNCIQIAKRCKELGVGIAVNSDAHVFSDVGDFPHAKAMLAEIEFPESLIMNTSLEKLNGYLRKH